MFLHRFRIANLFKLGIQKYIFRFLIRKMKETNINTSINRPFPVNSREKIYTITKLLIIVHDLKLTNKQKQQFPVKLKVFLLRTSPVKGCFACISWDLIYCSPATPIQFTMCFAVRRCFVWHSAGHCSPLQRCF